MFDIVIRLDEEYFLGAIDIPTNTFITAEDTCCFQTVDKLAKKHIGLLNRPEIIYRLEDRAYAVKHIEGFTTNESKPRLVVDCALLMFAGREDDVSVSVIKAIEETEGYELTDELRATIMALEAEIEERSNHWGKFKAPKYPLDNTFGEQLGMDTNCEIAEDAMITTGVREDAVIMRDPFTLLSFPIADAQSIVRAYSESLVGNSYMLSDVEISTTSEFNDSEEDDNDEDDQYRVSTSELMPNLSQIISFKYYIPELILDQNLQQIAKEAVDSVHYKQNIRMLNPMIRANNECLQYITGSETIAEELNPNEKYMAEALKVLLMDLIMYEYSVYNVVEVDKLGAVRSKLFDSYMLDLLKRVLIENYSYTGKASMSFNDDNDDDSSAGAFGIFGYSKIVNNGGTFQNLLTQEEWLKIKGTLNPDGPQRIDRYLRSLVNSNAYGEMLIYMLRFGQTKSRYVKVKSLEDTAKPYFDTLTFEAIQQPLLATKYIPAKTEHGKDFYLDGSVYLHREFEELSGHRVGLPIAVVLKKTMIAGTATKFEYQIMDINSFCAVALSPVNGVFPYEIEGIDLVSGKVEIDAEYLRANGETRYGIDDVVHMINSDDDNCIIATSTKIIRPLSKYKLDANIKTQTPVSIYDAYKELEDFKFSYADINQEFSPVDCRTPVEYVHKKILKDLLAQLFNQTLSSQFRDVSIVDILLEKKGSLSYGETGEATSALNFNSLLQHRTQSCKIMKDGTDELMGYMFKSMFEGKNYILLSSTEDIGLSLPTDSTWYKYPYSKIVETLIKPYEKSTNKNQFIKNREEKGMYFSSNETITLLSK